MPTETQITYLPDEQRHDVWAEFIRKESETFEPMPLTKEECKELVDSVDTWITDNMEEINNSLPAKAREELTIQQKARIFFAVTRAKIQGI